MSSSATLGPGNQAGTIKRWKKNRRMGTQGKSGRGEASLAPVVNTNYSGHLETQLFYFIHLNGGAWFI